MFLLEKEAEGTYVPLSPRVVLEKALQEIEKMNILQASLLAMKRAILKLKKKPNLILVDGNKLPDLKNYKLKYVIKGDQKIPSISAATPHRVTPSFTTRTPTRKSSRFARLIWRTAVSRQWLVVLAARCDPRHHLMASDWPMLSACARTLASS